MVNMYSYVKEEPVVLGNIIDDRKKITMDFISVLEKNDIREIIFVASGSSYNAAFATKYFMQKMMKVKVSVIYPYTFNHYENIFNKDSLIVGISQSGKSAATIEALEKANNLGLRNIVLTADVESKISKYVENITEISCGEEIVSFKTKGYTSTLLTLYLIAIETAYMKKFISLASYNGYIKNLKNIVKNLDNIIDSTDNWYENNKNDLIKTDKIMVIGYGSNYGTALEGGLKLNETVRCSVNSHELEEFMHGPYLSLKEDIYMFFISSPGEGKKRINDLYNYVLNITKHCYMITNIRDDNRKNLIGNFIAEEDFSPLEFVIPFQILSFKLATDKGIDLSVSKFPDFDDYLKSKI